MSDSAQPQVFKPVRYGQFLVAAESVNKTVKVSGLDPVALLTALKSVNTQGVILMDISQAAALPLISKELSPKWADSDGDKQFQAYHSGMVGLFDDYRKKFGLNAKPILVARDGDNLSVSGQLDSTYEGEWNSVEPEKDEEPDPFYVKACIRNQDGFSLNSVDRTTENVEAYVSAKAFLELTQSSWVEFMVAEGHDKDVALGLASKVEFGIGSFRLTGKPQQEPKPKSKSSGGGAKVSYNLTTEGGVLTISLKSDGTQLAQGSTQAEIAEQLKVSMPSIGKTYWVSQWSRKDEFSSLPKS